MLTYCSTHPYWVWIENSIFRKHLQQEARVDLESMESNIKPSALLGGKRLDSSRHENKCTQYSGIWHAWQCWRKHCYSASVYWKNFQTLNNNYCQRIIDSKALSPIACLNVAFPSFFWGIFLQKAFAYRPGHIASLPVSVRLRLRVIYANDRRSIKCNQPRN